MKEWRERLDQQLSLLVEEGTLTVEYKNAVLVQGFLERFIETVAQEEYERGYETCRRRSKRSAKEMVREEREKVVEEIIDYGKEFKEELEGFYSPERIVLNDFLLRIQRKYPSRKGEKK